MYELHLKKDYKDETLFTAVNIFDKYLSSIGVLNFKKSNLMTLVVISLLMAAKLEQPISPNFARMISLLSEEE